MEIVEVVLRCDDGHRWAGVTVSWRKVDPGIEYPVRSPNIVCQIEPLDELAEKYSLGNWESGVISGIQFGFRHLQEKYRGTVIHAIRGVLRAEDMPVLNWVGTIAIAELLHRDWTSIATPGWHPSLARPDSCEGEIDSEAIAKIGAGVGNL